MCSHSCHKVKFAPDKGLTPPGLLLSLILFVVFMNVISRLSHEEEVSGVKVSSCKSKAMVKMQNEPSRVEDKSLLEAERLIILFMSDGGREQ